MSAVQENVELSGFNTFGVSVKTRFFIEISDEKEINDLLKSGMLSAYSYFVLGGGSNVLFTKNFEGLIIHPVIRGIDLVEEINGEVVVRVGAGENWDDFVAYCVKNGWCGIENLSWIPGLVGACPVQNIGAYGTEVMDLIDTVEGYNLESGLKFSLPAKECKFSYRNSIFKNELKNKVIITHVLFRLNKENRFNTAYPDVHKALQQVDTISLQTIREAIIEIRKRKLPDPSEIGNAGSFFKNPVVTESISHHLKTLYPSLPVYKMDNGTDKLSAAWLIDQCGWKGKRMGNAGTHIHQPLILVNLGGAAGSEILDLAKSIQQSVFKQFTIHLEMEVNVM